MTPYYLSSPQPLNINSQVDDRNIATTIPGAGGSYGQPSDNGSNVGGTWSGQGINYGTAAAGIGAMIGDTVAQAHTKLGLPQYQQGLQYSGGRPSYSGDQYIAASNLRPRSNKLTEGNWQKLIGDTSKGFGQGFSSGGLYGAFLQGSIGTFTNSAGPVGVQHDREQHQKDVAMQQAKAYQTNYNTASQSADQNENAYADYSRRLARSKRFSNLYATPSYY